MSLNWQIKEITPAWSALPDEVKQSIVFRTMHVGIFGITESNFEKFFQRSAALDKAMGQETYLSLDEVKSAVGLGTNAAPMTEAAFKRYLRQVELDN